MVMKKGSVVFLLVVFLLSLLGAALSFGQGLGKFSEWSEAVNLGPTVNSQFNDRFPAVSPDGLSLYFQSNRPGGFGADDFWVSQRVRPDAPWGEPKNLGPPVNTSSDERAPTFSPDGKSLYFVSDRPGGCGSRDIWISRRRTNDDFGWEPPVNLGCRVNTDAEDSGPAYFKDSETGIVTLYFHSNRPGVGREDIYASMPRGDSFGSGSLVWELSTPQGESKPAIRLDGLEVFVHSDRPGGLGARDLWGSTRETTQDAWLSQVNLGPRINSPTDELGPALSSDGTTLYFNSNRPGGVGGEDLYSTTRRKLHVVTSMSFDPTSVVFGGSFSTTLSGQNLTAETYFDIRFRVPDSAIDEVALNWQRGTSTRHTVASGTAVGTWIVTGVRAHQDMNDHSGHFAPLSATLTVRPF